MDLQDDEMWLYMLNPHCLEILVCLPIDIIKTNVHRWSIESAEVLHTRCKFRIPRIVAQFPYTSIL